jgi:site-specific DNA recombinase
VPADAAEGLVQQCIVELGPRRGLALKDIVARVEVYPTTVQVVVRRAAFFARPGDAEGETRTLAARLPSDYRVTAEVADPTLVRVTLPRRLKFRGGRIVVADASGRPVDTGVRADPVLIRALRLAHELLAEAGGGVIGAPERAVLQSSPANPYDRNLVRLAFLAPDLQTQILEGRQPTGLTLQRFIAADLPASWDDQRLWFATLN